MGKDYWFARHNGRVYLAIAEHGGPPEPAQLVKNPTDAINKAHLVGIVIDQVGICSAEALGL